MTNIAAKVERSSVLTLGSEVLSDGIRFTAAICHGEKEPSPKLVLFRTPDMERTDVELSDAYAVGNVYSVFIKGLKPNHLVYCYEVNGRMINDPFAHRLISVDLDEKEVRMGALSELSHALLTPFERSFSKEDRLCYLLNVRGFTMGKGAKVPSQKKGTFDGVTHKIPYLQELGITTAVLMPVNELTPARVGRERMLPSLFDLGLSSGKKENYWRFGPGYYFAPASSLSRNNHPELEYQNMIREFHKAGIEVVQQLWFPGGISPQFMRDIIVFYRINYGIDGFELIGSDLPLKQLSKDPLLQNTLLFFTHFEDSYEINSEENPYILKSATSYSSVYKSKNSTNLYDCNDDYLYLVRKFVKGDDLIINDFARKFLSVPVERGDVHFAATYNTFTLLDTVTYSCKHNEQNGEENHDGTDNNASWNCGVEGPTKRRDIVRLRRQMQRNLLTLVLLSQGTPLILAGDEFGNTQNGNNNPYCQDNETGWTSWKDTKENREFLDYARKLISFRKEHAVFRKADPFRYSDYRSFGFPDVSFHGQDAWKADFSGYSHSLGVLFCEDYEAPLSEAAARKGDRSLLFVGMNMYWQPIEFGLPKLPEGYAWYRVMDTSLDKPFLESPKEEAEIKCTAHERSVLILKGMRKTEKA